MTEENSSTGTILNPGMTDQFMIYGPESETLTEAIEKALAGDDETLCILLDIILPDLVETSNSNTNNNKNRENIQWAH